MHKHQNYHLLPDFPRIPHLLHQPTVGRLILSPQEEAVAHVLENKTYRGRKSWMVPTVV